MKTVDTNITKLCWGGLAFIHIIKYVVVAQKIIIVQYAVLV